jgi:hypothetical protein
MDWRDGDRFEYYDRKRNKCAEVLVPHCVESGYLTRAYVVDRPAAARLMDFGFDLPISDPRSILPWSPPSQTHVQSPHRGCGVSIVSDRGVGPEATERGTYVDAALSGGILLLGGTDPMPLGEMEARPCFA